MINQEIDTPLSAPYLFDIDTHIAKKEVEIERHREFISYLEGLGVREDIYSYMIALVSSKIAQCEISIRDHAKNRPSGASALGSVGHAKLREDFEAAKMEVVKRVVKVFEGRDAADNDMRYFEFIKTATDNPNFPSDTLFVETIVYKNQIICKLSASNNGQITIYPYSYLP